MTDNAKNAVNLLMDIPETYNLTCDAHSIWLTVNNVLRQNGIDTLIQLSSKMVE